MSSLSTQPGSGLLRYERHRPETMLLYQLVEQYYPQFRELMVQQETPLPGYIQQEFEAYLKCGRLEYGFLRVRCESCHHEKLAAFSCKKRGFCHSCGARRMVDSAALLTDEVLPKVPLRQRVLSVPFQLRFLVASYPELMGRALGIAYRTIATWLVYRGGFTHSSARTGVVTFIQRFGSALNLNVHFHILFLDGVYITGLDESKQLFRRIRAPDQAALQALVSTIASRLARFLVKEGSLEQDVENS